MSGGSKHRKQPSPLGLVGQGRAGVVRIREFGGVIPRRQDANLRRGLVLGLWGIMLKLALGV